MTGPGQPRTCSHPNVRPKMEWSQPGVLVCTTKDGMVTAWNAGMYDQRWNGHSLKCWYVRPKMEWSQPGVLVCMTKDGMVSTWSAGMYDQRWNGLSLECWYVRPKMEWSQPGAEEVVI